MGFLSNAVGQMIASMEPDERRDAITQVTGQALALMTPEERFDLTKQLFVMLLGGLDADQRRQLSATVAAAQPATGPDQGD
jgi:hypothetical protein